VDVLLFNDLRQICLVISINVDIDVHRHGISIIFTSELLQIWQICLVVSVDIDIDVRRLDLGVDLLLLISYIKAALDI
jgi:hypothetical protein